MFSTTPGSRKHIKYYGLICARVGPDYREFFLPKRRLCHYPYFEKAFYGEFMESRNDVICFEDETSAMFTLFVRWFLSKTIIPSLNVDPQSAEISWQTLFDVWMFGEMTLIQGLQDAVTDAMIHLESKTHTGPMRTIDIWTDLRPNSGLRRYLVDLHVQRVDLSAFVIAEAKLHRHHEEMLALIEGKQWDTKDVHPHNFWESRCDYHACCPEWQRCDEICIGW